MLVAYLQSTGKARIQRDSPTSEKTCCLLCSAITNLARKPHGVSFIYDSFGAGIDGTMQPGTDPEAPIHMNPPKDDGTTTAPSGTLQAYLDKIAKSIKDIKGTSTWDATVAQSLTQAITWRSPVMTANALPTNGNRVGDIRYVISTNMLYVWTSSGWRSPGIDGVAASGGSSVSQIAMMQTGAQGISAFLPVVRSSEGLKVADAANV